MQKCFRLQDRVGKVIREIVLPDGDREKFRAHLGRHLARFFLLVVVGAIEGQGEGADRIGMMFRREPENRAGIETAAEITAHRNVGAQAEANRFLQRMTEFRGIVGIGTLGRVPGRPLDNRNPNIGCSWTCLSVASR